MPTATSFVPEDVMKLFAQSFASGSQAIEAGQRIGLAQQSQALDSQKLQLQSQELQQQSQEAAAKIALQRENIAADAALKGQDISMRHQEMAKDFLFKQQQMEQDKLSFAENIRAARAAEENQRLKLAANIDNVEKQNKLKAAALDIEREKNKGITDYKDLVMSEQKQKQEEAVQFRKMNFLIQEFNNVKKEAYVDPNNKLLGIKPGFSLPNGDLNKDKIYEIAKSRTNRFMDATGGSVQSYPPREVSLPDAPIDTTGNSQQSPDAQETGPRKGILSSLTDTLVDQQAKTWAEEHPNDPRSKKIKQKLGIK